MKRLLAGFLAVILCMASGVISLAEGLTLEEQVTLPSTRELTALLDDNGYVYELYMLNDGSYELVFIPVDIGGARLYIHVYMGTNGYECLLYVWDVSFYDPARFTELLPVLNELNAGSRTVCFYADTTLCSVNAFSNQLYREVGVGQTVYEAVQLMYEALAEALPVLSPFAPA